MSDMDSILGSLNKGKVISAPLSQVHKYYISGVIGEASEYIDIFEVLRNASENDVIVFHINSYGGDMFTTIQFLAAMQECNGHIVALIEGACMSGATMIFLAADVHQISDHSMFMVHNYSGGSIGKGGEMYDSITHERSWSERWMKDIYQHFLTAEEIASVLDGKDMWLDSDSVNARLDTRVELFEEAAKKPVKKTVKKPTKKGKPSTTKKKTEKK
jgi:ATP-dependent protease ClpP protease subunit